VLCNGVVRNFYARTKCQVPRQVAGLTYQLASLELGTLTVFFQGAHGLTVFVLDTITYAVEQAGVVSGFGPRVSL
jgi:hypothetical protein